MTITITPEELRIHETKLKSWALARADAGAVAYRQAQIGLVGMDINPAEAFDSAVKKYDIDNPCPKLLPSV